jgi:hypothetical protein
MLRLKKILSLLGSSALSVLVLAFVSVPRSADAAAQKDRAANRPRTQSTAKKRPQPAAPSSAELYARYSKVTQALEALAAARQQVDTYSNETVALARRAQRAAIAESVTGAADFFVEAAAKLAPKPIAPMADVVNKAYKNAREHAKALREADEESRTIAGLRAVVGDIEMVTGVQVEPGGSVTQALATSGSIAKLSAGINALDAQNRARKGKAAESAFATVKTAVEMANALGNKDAAKSWKVVLSLLSSANNLRTSMDNIGEAAELEGEGRLLQSVRQRIAEGEVSLKAKQTALRDQMDRLAVKQFGEIPRLTEMPKFEVLRMPKYETVKVPNLEVIKVPKLERFEVPKLERFEVPKLERFEIPKTYEMLRVPAPVRDCSPIKEVIDALTSSITNNRIGQAGARAQGLHESAAAYGAMIQSETQELGRQLAEFEKCRR